MLETGLRVSDAIRFDPRLLERDEDGPWVYTYTPKKWRTGKKRIVFDAFITDRLKTAIDNCDWFSEELPFWFGGSVNRVRGEMLGVQVYHNMHTVGERCGVTDCRPHRLRDTFAVRMLLRGVSIDDVSRFLGHSDIKVTQAHYLRWVPARRARLASVFTKSVLAQPLVNAGNNALGNRKRSGRPKNAGLVRKQAVDRGPA
jgi:integrase